MSYKMVMKTANQSSCVLMRTFASDLQWPVLISYTLPMTTNIQVVCMYIISTAQFRVSTVYTHCKSQPSDEPMVLLEDVVVGVTNPRESAQNRDDNEDVGDDAGREHGFVLDSSIPDNFDDLVKQPAICCQTSRFIGG